MREKRNKFNWQLLSILVLAIALISVTIFAVNKETEEIASQEPEVIYVGHDDEEVLDNFSREAAVLALQDLLKDIGNDVADGERSIQERMEALDDGETDLEEVIHEDTIDKLYLSEDFMKTKFNRQFTASALLTYHQLIAELTTETDKTPEFTPVVEVYEEIVYLDSTLKTAHIPIDIFIGENRGIAFEMQYIDGEWKFNPYTSMMSLVMLINYETQIEMLLGEQQQEPVEE